MTSNATLNDSVRDQEGIESLTRYYDDTWLDYRLVWLNRENLALHFGYYDDQHRRHRKALANMNRVLADLAGVRPEHRVLDAGCGVGGSSFWLAEERGAKVVGITPVQSQVDRANAVARQRGLEEQVKFKREDYRNCSQPNASFDVVCAPCSTPEVGCVMVGRSFTVGPARVRVIVAGRPPIGRSDRVRGRGWGRDPR